MLHICTREAWEQAQAQGVYEAPSLHTEGFIHCSTPAQCMATLNRHYQGQTDLVILAILAARVQAEIKWERAANGELYPHVYGPLNLDAIMDATPLTTNAKGAWERPATAS